MRNPLRWMYRGFPDGRNGMALLLLRMVVAVSLVMDGFHYLGACSATPAQWLIGSAALLGGSFLFVGLLTPIAAAVILLGGFGVWVAALPACTKTLLDSKSAVIFGVTMLSVILLMGPGATSIDARIFGLREILLPLSNSRRRR